MKATMIRAGRKPLALPSPPRVHAGQIPARALMRDAKLRWSVQGRPDWNHIVPVVAYALEQTLPPGWKNQAEYCTRIEATLPRLQQKHFAQIELPSGETLGRQFFVAMRMLQITWLEVLVHTLRHHPIAEVAQHFCDVETYHLGQFGGNDAFTSQGRMDFDKVRAAFAEVCAQIVGVDGDRISRKRMEQRPLLYFNAKLNAGIFKALLDRRFDWKNYLPSFAKHFMDPVSAGKTSASEFPEFYPITNETAACEILGRVGKLAFLAEPLHRSPLSDVQLIQNVRETFAGLTTEDLAELSHWWRNADAPHLVPEGDDTYIGYRLVAYALRHHPDQRLQDGFADVGDIHHPHHRRSFWHIGNVNGRAHVRNAINEAVSLMTTAAGISPRKTENSNALLRDFLSRQSRRTLVGAPLRYGAKLPSRLFRDNFGLSDQALILDALQHHPNADIRQLATDHQMALFDDPKAAEREIARRRQEFLLTLETRLGLVDQRRDPTAYTACMNVGLRTSLHRGLSATVREKRLPVKLEGNYGILGRDRGGPIAVAVDALRNHPDPTYKNYYADLGPQHFSYRQSIYIRADGETDWPLVDRVLFEAHRVYMSDTLGVDVRQLNPQAVLASAWERLPKLRVADIEGAPLLYGARVGHHFLEAVGDSAAGLRDVFFRTIARNDAVFLKAQRDIARRIAISVWREKYRHVQDRDFFTSSAELGVESALRNFRYSEGQRFESYLSTRVPGQIKDDLYKFDPFNLRRPEQQQETDWVPAAPSTEVTPPDNRAAAQAAILRYGATPRRQITVWLHYLNAMPQVRIARLLGLSESTISNLLTDFRADAVAAVEREKQEQAAKLKEKSDLEEAIARLAKTTQERAVLAAALIEGKPHHEIAAAHGIGKSTVSVRIMRFRQRIMA